MRRLQRGGDRAYLAYYLIDTTPATRVCGTCTHRVTIVPRSGRVIAIEGKKVITIATRQRAPWQLALGSDAIYWLDGPAIRSAPLR